MSTELTQSIEVPDPWPAPRATRALSATVEVPGSKSITNRAFVLAALAGGATRLVRPLMARDTSKMIDGLRLLGIDVQRDERQTAVPPADATSDGSEPDCWVVSGTVGTTGESSEPITIHTGLAGTVMRFLPPIAALAGRPVTFTGDPAATARPQGSLLAGLRQLGVAVDDGGRGRLPFTVDGSAGITGREVSIDASASSQFVSGLLLAAPAYPKGLLLRHTGDSLPSLPHIDMTVDMLRRSGVQISTHQQAGEYVWEVAPGPLSVREFDIEPDLSNAAPFLAAAMVAGGTVRVAGWPTDSTQPGMRLPELLTAMGGEVRRDGGALEIRGTGVIHGLTADLHDVGELTPTIAALCALADGPSSLRGIAHLRGHETDRLAALATELNGLGGDVTETPDGLEIRPRPLSGGLFHTYEDHRIATAAALLGLAVDDVRVEDVATTAKTLPDFPRRWAHLLGTGAS